MDGTSWPMEFNERCLHASIKRKGSSLIYTVGIHLQVFATPIYNYYLLVVQCTTFSRRV